jgi:hypothetical protein
MITDIRKMPKGSTVKLRCGGELTNCYMIADYPPDNNNKIIIFSGDDYIGGDYKTNGKVFGYLEHPLDIIEIIPPPFDWSDAKSGMCFIQENGEKVYFIGDDFSDERFIIVATKSLTMENAQVRHLAKAYLTRFPEGDVNLKGETE